MMKLLRRSLAMIFLFGFMLISPMSISAFAAENEATNQHVYDDAGLLSTTELTEVESLCTKYSNQDGMDMIILTTDKAQSVDSETYIENFYDQQYDNHTINKNSVILLIDLNIREVFIEGYGRAKYYISSGRIDHIVEQITPNLSSAEYAPAMKQFLELSNHYANTAPFFLSSWFHLCIAAVIGGIVVGIMAYHSGGRMTVNGGTYMDPNQSGLIGRRDDYIRTHITRVRKPQNNGGGGGGVSAGGHSHSSGGGKF